MRHSVQRRAGGWLTLGIAAILAACGGGETQGPSGSAKLVLQVTGLPGGAVPRLLVAGPGVEVRHLSAAGTLSGLAAGTYTVSGLHVVTGGQDYTASAAPGTVTLTGSESDTVLVTYTGNALPSINFRIDGIQLFQSSQTATNSIPMVAGRAALLRVFVLANQSSSAPLKVRVHLFQSGTLVDSLTATGPVPVPQVNDTASLSATWNFTIPANRMTAGLSFDAMVDPDDQYSEASESDNRFPGGSGRFTPTVLTVPPVRLRLVPVRQQVNGSLGNVNTANQSSYTDLIKRIFPLSTLTVDVRAAYTTSAPALVSGDSNGAWIQILSELNALRASEGGDRYYYGVVHPSYNSGIAGLGYVGLPAAIGWDKGNVDGVAAHEVGHNFGRQHAPCGNPGSPDAGYPYPGAVIGAWGYDQGTNTLKAPLAYTDLMSYCSPNWISDYTYLGVFNFLTGGAAIQVAAAPGLLVWGRIVGDSIVLEPAFRVNAPARLPSATGPYHLTGTAADGSTSFDLSFAGDLVADHPGLPARHFAFVIPMSEARAAGLATIRLSSISHQSVRRAATAAASPQVDVEPAGAGHVSLRWDPAYPMAVVRDESSGAIVAFARGGSATIAASGGVTVELSRGPASVPAVVRGRK